MNELYGGIDHKFHLVPHGIRGIVALGNARDELEFPETIRPVWRFERRAIFCGNDVEHNRVAVEFIVKKLAPLLEDEIGFIISGPCGRRFRDSSGRNVVFDDDYGGLVRYAGPGTVAIHPITCGSGANLKVIDYLAHHLPVVSTAFGMRGYPDLRRFVTESPLDGFSDGIRRAEPLPPDIDEALKKYLWSNIAYDLKGVYEGVLG